MGFRDYNPQLNRFLARDTYNGALADLNLGTNPWTGNRYAFTAGNPTTYIERDGHEPRPWHDPNFDPDSFDYESYIAAEQIAFARADMRQAGLPTPDCLSCELAYQGLPTAEDVAQSHGLDPQSIPDELLHPNIADPWWAKAIDTYLDVVIAVSEVASRKGYTSGTGCLVLCLSVTSQGGHLQLSVGAVGFGGWAGAAGATTADVEDQANWQWVGSGSAGVGACGQLGPRTDYDDGEFHAYGGGCVTAGVGGQAGMMVTLIDFDIDRLRVSFPAFEGLWHGG